jgi:regulator of sigma E protease
MGFVLGVMILVHEFGHFAVAKLLGVRVEQFAFGFGKRLFGFRRGETEYRINLLPLGGYVKMAGETPKDSHTGDPGEFTSHPRWQRFLIAIAGPAMNILLAIVLVAVVYMVHYVHPAYLDNPAVVGYITPDSPAAQAGIREGDRIIRIDNQQNPTWEDVEFKVLLNPRQPLSIAVQRGGEILDKTVTPMPEGPEGGGDAGLVANRPIQVAQVEPTMPAAKAGLRAGDLVVAIDNQPLSSIEALLGFLEQNQGRPTTVTVMRAGHPVQLPITPVKSEVGGQTRYRLGFMSSEPVKVTRLPFFRAFSRSFATNKRYSKMIVDLVQKMVERKASMKQIAGPIGIGAAAGQAARQPGWTPLISLMALISLNLGIFNLLPIPILDGGLILLLFVEAVMRRDISQPVKERIYQAAFVLLLLVGILVIYNDLARALPGLRGRMP